MILNGITTKQLEYDTRQDCDESAAIRVRAFARSLRLLRQLLEASCTSLAINAS